MKKHEVMKKFTIIALVLFLAVISGCSSAGNNLANSGDGGSYSISVAWPDESSRMDSQKIIPAESTLISLSITGDGIPNDTPITTSISAGTTTLTISHIPIGPKVALIKSLDGSGKITAQRKESFSINNDETTTSDSIPLGIAITKDGSNNTIFEPSYIKFSYGTQLYFQNWTNESYTCRIKKNNIDNNTVDLPVSAVSTDETGKTVFSQCHMMPLEKSPFSLVEEPAAKGVSTAVVKNYESVLMFGEFGTGDGQFKQPYSMTFDQSGKLYVCDMVNSRIQVFNSSGILQTKWGSLGNGDYQFSLTDGIAIDSQGYIYVSDWNYSCIRKFDSSLHYQTRWGSWGPPYNQFAGAYAMSVDKAGYLYIADVQNHRIQKTDSNGGFISRWGSQGSEDNKFNQPYATALDSEGNVYVADCYNHRIQKTNSVGVPLSRWGSFGTDDGMLEYPSMVATDSSDNIFVSDCSNHRIQKFDSLGNFITKWGSSGTNSGNFNCPDGIAIDNNCNIYISERSNNRIQKFSPTF